MPPELEPLNRAVDVMFSLVPVVGAFLAFCRWVDAYRLAKDIPLPVPVAWRVLLARYNLLAVSTHIYRGFQALKNPTRAS